MDVTDVAARVPATRRSLLRRTAIIAALVTAAAVLGVAAVVQLRALRADDELQARGSTTQAEVVAVDARLAGGRGQWETGSVTVEYDAGGQTHRAVVGAGLTISDREVGDRIPVVYDEADPGRVAIAGLALPPPGPPAVLLAAFGALAAAMAVIAARNVRAIRTAVRSEPWLFVRTRIEQTSRPGSGRGSRTFVVLETPAGEVAVEAIGLNRVSPDFVPAAWVAGLDGATMALAEVGGGHVVAVRRERLPAVSDPHP